MAQYTLKLSFDLRQVTQSLGYEFVLDQKANQQNKSNYPMVDSGPLAGTFNFQEGDEISVEVEASSAAHPNGQGVPSKDVLNNFSVADCTFVSVPARMTDLLSLFDAKSACTPVEGGWKPIKEIPHPGGENLKRFSIRSNQPLKVNTKSGQWQISGYLSVELFTDDGQSHVQLYFFDPEGSSGTGD